MPNMFGEMSRWQDGVEVGRQSSWPAQSIATDGVTSIDAR